MRQERAAGYSAAPVSYVPDLALVSQALLNCHIITNIPQIFPCSRMEDICMSWNDV